MGLAASTTQRRRISAKFERILAAYVRTLRLSAYFTFVFFAFGLVAAGALYAQVKEATVGIGRALSRLEDVTQDVETVHFNGAVVHRATGHTKESVTEVLDRVEKHCADSPSLLMQYTIDHVDGLDKVSRAKAEVPPSLSRGVLREGDDNEALVACIVGTRDQLSESLVSQLAAFGKTMDLSIFGQLRYVTARKTKSGGTYVTTQWTEGHVEMAKLFPATGDAPGSDPDAVPRPANSRRLVAASVESQPYGAWLFEREADVETTRRSYEVQLEGGGYTRATAQDDDRGTAFVREDGLIVYVSYTTSPQKKTIVTVIEGGRTDSPSIAVGTATARESAR